VPEGRVISGTTSHLDVLPTLLGRLGVGSAETARFPGVDLLGGGSPLPYAALVMVQRPGHRRDDLALVGESGRFGLQLLRDRDEVLFLGALDADGRPSPRPVSREEGRVFLGWFQDYLQRCSRTLHTQLARVGP
jgi:hypothetical protein